MKQGIENITRGMLTCVQICLNNRGNCEQIASEILASANITLDNKDDEKLIREYFSNLEEFEEIKAILDYNKER